MDILGFNIYHTGGKGQKVKAIIILIVIIFLILLAVFVSGGIYKSRSLEIGMVELKDSLTLTEKNLADKQIELDSYLSELNSTSVKKEFFEKEFSRLQDENKRFQDENSVFKEVIGNSVRSFCCSFDEIQQGTERDWGLSSSSIICAGDYEVDCGSGESIGFE